MSEISNEEYEIIDADSWELKRDMIDKFQEQGEWILQYFWGDKFGKPIGMDIILIYDEEKK